MNKQRDIMIKTIATLYLKAFPDTPAGRVPSTHQIADQMGCLNSAESSVRGVCPLHETMAEGFMRMRTLGECPVCSKNWIDDEIDVSDPQEMAWKLSNIELPIEPQVSE